MIETYGYLYLNQKVPVKKNQSVDEIEKLSDKIQHLLFTKTLALVAYDMKKKSNAI